MNEGSVDWISFFFLLFHSRKWLLLLARVPLPVWCSLTIQEKQQGILRSVIVKLAWHWSSLAAERKRGRHLTKNTPTIFSSSSSPLSGFFFSRCGTGERSLPKLRVSRKNLCYILRAFRINSIFLINIRKILDYYKFHGIETFSLWWPSIKLVATNELATF